MVFYLLYHGSLNSAVTEPFCRCHIFAISFVPIIVVCNGAQRLMTHLCLMASSCVHAVTSVCSFLGSKGV